MKNKSKNVKLLTYEELVSAWWSIHNGYSSISNKQLKDHQVRIAFETLLKQCGWTVEEWNAENDKVK